MRCSLLLMLKALPAGCGSKENSQARLDFGLGQTHGLRSLSPSLILSRAWRYWVQAQREKGWFLYQVLSVLMRFTSVSLSQALTTSGA